MAFVDQGLGVEIDERELQIDILMMNRDYHARVYHVRTGLLGQAVSTSSITARREAMQDLERQLASRSA